MFLKITYDLYLKYMIFVIQLKTKRKAGKKSYRPLFN